jgi:hypothetical protein
LEEGWEWEKLRKIETCPTQETKKHRLEGGRGVRGRFAS